jgi:competence protein ComFC
MLPTPPPDPVGWRKWLGRGLDLLYPPACAVCREILTHGRSLCASCDADLPRLAEPFCQSCGEMFEGQIDDQFSCPNCHRLKFAFEFARPATPRDERTLEMIHRLKYNRELHLAAELGRLAAAAFADPRLETALQEKWPLIPVPLHRRRFQHRHFNQAEEIARSLSSLTGLPLLPVLRRIRHTGHQTTLTRSQRLENLRGAFAVTPGGLRDLPEISGAILIDDVLTTGSTVDECAKVLRRAGLRRIAVVTVMRG